jgi:hypothetical protein
MASVVSNELIGIVAWVLFAGMGAEYVEGTYIASTTELRLAELFIKTLEGEGYVIARKETFNALADPMWRDK